MTGVQEESLSLWHGDRSSRGSHLLLPQHIIRKAEKKEPLYQSTAIPQWEYPCDDWSRRNLIGPSAVGKRNNSANFHNNINRNSKLPKSLTTMMPTFDGKSEKFELFEDLFQTSLKFHNQLTEDDRISRISYSHSLMRGVALQTFKYINGPTRENLGEIPAVFRRKYVKPKSKATAKHKFQKLVFNPANQKIVDFPDEFQNSGQRRIWYSCPCHHRTIHIRQNATTLEGINKSGPFGEWHKWSDCHTPRKVIRAYWFGSSWRATNKRCEPLCHQRERWKTQTNVPPL